MCQPHALSPNPSNRTDPHPITPSSSKNNHPPTPSTKTLSEDSCGKTAASKFLNFIELFSISRLEEMASHRYLPMPTLKPISTHLESIDTRLFDLTKKKTFRIVRVSNGEKMPKITTRRTQKTLHSISDLTRSTPAFHLAKLGQPGVRQVLPAVKPPRRQSLGEQLQLEANLLQRA